VNGGREKDLGIGLLVFNRSTFLRKHPVGPELKEGDDKDENKHQGHACCCEKFHEAFD
jgi:hypothetical protein